MSRFSGIAILLLAAVLLSPPVIAGKHKDNPRYENAYEYSLENAVSRAKRHYKGRVLSAETDRRNGNGTYRIRILTDDGRVKRLRVDPDTGDFIRPDRKRR